MAAPEPLYYLAIDGTDAQDAAIFGALMEGRGWQNLATTFLKPAVDNPFRLVDPVHEFLSIIQFTRDGKKVAVVSPNGFNGTGTDPFWTHYPATVTNKDGITVGGRYAAAELSAEFVQQLIMAPAIHTHELQPDVLSRHFADNRLPYPSSHAPAARILYVSSHGWQSGIMRGDPLKDDDAQPEATRNGYDPTTPYFLLGRAVQNEAGFHGPEWIILAQCSTLNSSAWPLWARVLARSAPGVRGILAYEEASPKPKSAVAALERFFKRLDQGAPFLDAWADANRYVMWSAIVHAEARKDTLRDFPRFRRLSTVATSSDKAHYYGYLSSLGSTGDPIFDRRHPFSFKLEHAMGDPPEFEHVVPERLDTRTARIIRDHKYRFTIYSPPGSVVREVRLTVVHIRLSLPEQFSWGHLFSSFRGVDGTQVDGFGTTTLTLRPGTPDAYEVVFEVAAQNPGRAGLHPHSYLWFRVAMQTDSRTIQEDFREFGLYR
jgi:hypothetical protein